MPVRRQSTQGHDMNGVSICKTYDCESVALSFNPVLLLLLSLLRGLLWFSCTLLYQSAKPNPKLSTNIPWNHCSCKVKKQKKNVFFSVFLIFQWQFTCLPKNPELRPSMQHSVPYNNIKKVNGWCKQILPKLIVRIYSIMYLLIFYACIPGIPEVILSPRILWTPKTTVWNHRTSFPSSRASFHPGQAMKELARVNATITIIQQIKEFLWNRNIHPDVRPNPPKTIFAVENVN